MWGAIPTFTKNKGGDLRVQPIKTQQPTFGWKINQQISHYGNNMMKSTEYYRDNGLKLLVVDSFRNGKQVTKTKELYNNKWQLLKCKVIEFVNGKKDKSYYI